MQESLSEVITNRGTYKYSSLAYSEQPEEMKKTADKRIAPSAFERMPLLFTESKPDAIILLMTDVNMFRCLVILKTNVVIVGLEKII